MGQTENTGCCDGLMHKNGEQNIIDFVCAKGRQVDLICWKSLAFL
jgi:hypothetical protein